MVFFLAGRQEALPSTLRLSPSVEHLLKRRQDPLQHGLPLSLASAMPLCISSIPIVICSAKPDSRSWSCSSSSFSSVVQIARTRASSAAAPSGGGARSSWRRGAKSAESETCGGEVGRPTVGG